MADFFLKINDTDFLLINSSGDRLIISDDASGVTNNKQVDALFLNTSVDGIYDE